MSYHRALFCALIECARGRRFAAHAAIALATAACGGGGSPSGSGGAGGSSAATLANGPSGPGSGAGGPGAGAGGPSSSVGSSMVGSGGAGSLTFYGDPYEGGQYNLGPVDYAETQWHNACAPGTKYSAQVQAVEGTLLVGLWGGIPNVAGYCDACIFVTTPTNKSALLRVVTYGDTTTNSIDVSQNAYDLLNTGEYPRPMTWQFVECPDTGPMIYEFQTGSSEWWTSLWVRNARVPLSKVEVQSPNHASFTELTRGGDGTLTDGGGFGNGSFTIRSTGVDGSQVTDTFQWPAAGIAGAMLTGAANFP